MFVHMCVSISCRQPLYTNRVSVHLQLEHPCGATSAHRTVPRAPLGVLTSAEKGSLSGWKSLSGSCAASPPGLCFSFLAFPRFPSLTGSSVLCPGNRLPHSNTQQGNSLPCSSPVSSHTKSQKRKKNLAGQPELNPFPFHVLGTHFQPPGTASRALTQTLNFHHKADSRFTSSPWAI